MGDDVKTAMTCFPTPSILSDTAGPGMIERFAARMLPVLRLLSLWLLIAACVISLGLMVVLMPLANALLTGAPLPGSYAELLLYWVLACGTLWLLRLGAGCLIGRRDERLRQALARGESLQFNARPGSIVLLVTVLALSALITYLGLSRGHTGTVLGGLAVSAVFVLVLWQLLWQIAQPGPILQMDHRVINHALFGPIPWTSVLGIELESASHRYGQIHYLCLGVRQVDIFMRRASLPRRWLLQLNGRAANTLRLPLNLIDADPQLVLEAARHCHANSSAIALAGWQPDMGSAELTMFDEMQQQLSDHKRMMALLGSLPDNPSPAQLDALNQALTARRPLNVDVLKQGRRQMLQRHQRHMRLMRQGRLLGGIGAGLLLLYLLWRLA